LDTAEALNSTKLLTKTARKSRKKGIVL
jgi:hypothetical protein